MLIPTQNETILNLFWHSIIHVEGMCSRLEHVEDARIYYFRKFLVSWMKKSVSQKEKQMCPKTCYNARMYLDSDLFRRNITGTFYSKIITTNIFFLFGLVGHAKVRWSRRNKGEKYISSSVYNLPVSKVTILSSIFIQSTL